MKPIFNFFPLLPTCFCFLLLNLLFYHQIYAQVGMQSTYGSTGLDKCNEITRASNGGAIIAGETENADGERSIVITRTDKNGNLIWAKTYNNGVFEMPNSVLNTSDGGFIIAGERYPEFGQRELAYIFKLNASGGQEWSRVYDSGGNMAEALAAKNTLDGGYIITGRAEQTLMVTNAFLPMTSEMRYLYLLKINKNGNPLWSRKYNTGQEVRMSRGNDVFSSRDGGYIIAGEFQHNLNTRKDLDMCLLKVNALGEVEWAKRYGGNKDDAGSEVIQTLDDGYLLCGETESQGAGKLDISLVKTDINGNLEWAKTYGNKGFDQVGAIAELKNGNIVIAGKSSTSDENIDALILVLDPSGNILNSNSYGGSKFENCVSVRVTDQGLLVGANTMSYGEGQMDILMLNLDFNGRSDCNAKNSKIQALLFTPEVSDVTSLVKSELIDEKTVKKTEGQGHTKVEKANIKQNIICK